MFGIELRQPGNPGAAGHFVERSISLAQADDVFFVEARQQFPKTPDTAFVGWES